MSIYLERSLSKTYSEYVFDIVDSFVTKLQYAPLHTISLGKVKIQNGAVAISHHFNELRFLYFIEWLIAGNDPTCEKVLEPFLIPRFLEKTN